METMAELEDNWAQVPKWLCRRVGPYEVAVYVALAMRVSGRAGTCFPSVRRIAVDSKISERRVHAALARLREVGAISWVAQANDLGDRTSNLYTVVFDKPEGE